MSVQGLGQPSILTGLARLLPGITAARSSIDSLNQNQFNLKVEKHLSDYRAGVGGLSSNVATRIFEKGESAALALDPKNLTAFTGYASGLSYSSKARFINNVSDTVSRLQQIIA